jgi:predicted DNA-binding transcriptional regulator YafY
MNRIDRLFGILLLLQTHRRIRAQDIAAHYEISERTVYRDISALMKLGVPIIGQAGEGYGLMEGFFLPPLIFTQDEAKALFLGAKMLETSGNLRAGAAQALEKLRAALPTRVLQEADGLATIIHFYFEQNQFHLDAPFLQDLQQAILNKQVVYLRYRNWDGQESTEREIEPFQLMYSTQAWYVTAYCRLRQDIRSFRLERIEAMRLLPKYFSTDYELRPAEPPHITVQVRFSEKCIRRVRERQHYGFQSETRDNSGRWVMTYQVHHLSEIKSWILGWGAEAEVLAPDELRMEILEEIQKLLTLLT